MSELPSQYRGPSKTMLIFRKELNGMKSSRSFMVVFLAAPVVIAFVVIDQFFIPASQLTAAATFELPLLAVIYSLTVAAMISIDSFIGERTTRTIEPLLAAPLSEKDLFVGKVLAAFVPAIAISYVLIAGMAGALILKFGAVALQTLPTQSLIQLFWEAPVLALIATSVMTIVSARVSDTRAAMQLGSYVMLGLVFGVGFLPSFLPYAETAWYGLAINSVLTVICIILLWVGVRTFNRESLLSRI